MQEGTFKSAYEAASGLGKDAMWRSQPKDLKNVHTHMAQLAILCQELTQPLVLLRMLLQSGTNCYKRLLLQRVLDWQNAAADTAADEKVPLLRNPAVPPPPSGDAEADGPPGAAADFPDEELSE